MYMSVVDMCRGRRASDLSMSSFVICMGEDGYLSLCMAAGAGDYYNMAPPPRTKRVPDENIAYSIPGLPLPPLLNSSNLVVF